jgi:four helix bundle suffix protein
MKNDDTFIPPHGNYQELLSYQKAAVVYDLTFRFCKRFLKNGDRTIDQMVQAARSGKQNIYVRKLGAKPHATFEIYRELCETRSAEVVANMAICLIHQTNYLLDRQIGRLEQDFLKEGGLRERMTRARLQAREQQRKGRGNR